MTNYYIEKDNKIVLFDEDLEKLQNTLKFMPKYRGLEIKTTDRPIVNFQFTDTEEYKEEQAQKRQEQFETEFFNTSLGYIRRKVTMANGDTKDFLTDLLPSIAMGIQLNQPVSIIAYKEPDFTEEITDLVKYQEVKQATAEFVQECFMQLNNDFIGDNSTGEASDNSKEDIESDINIEKNGKKSSNPPVDERAE